MATDKTSRYRADPAVTGPDSHGRVTLARDCRVLPVTTGTFRHVVADGDRVDQLAEKYYGEPLSWWQICDANPQFLSPWAMLGQEPVASAGYTIAPRGAGGWEALWSRLFSRLSALPGVEGVALDDDPDSDSAVRTHRIVVTYNRLTVSTRVLTEAITQSEFSVEEASVTSRLGKPIVIPPAGSG
jgi:hypothetical protein